jgi:hypothetical protein
MEQETFRATDEKGKALLTGGFHTHGSQRCQWPPLGVLSSPASITYKGLGL